VSCPHDSASCVDARSALHLDDAPDVALSRSKGCVDFYSVTFFALLLLHAACAIGFLFFEDKTISLLQDLNSHADDDRIRDYLDAHRRDFKIVSLVVLALEVFTFTLAICARQSVSGSLDDEVTSEMDTRRVGLLHSEAHYTAVSATPQTDAHRARLSEKYGHAFSKPSQTGYEVL
jgi:hypothetical protein